MKLDLRLGQRISLFYVVFAGVILTLVGGLAWYSGRSILQDAATSNLVLTAAQNETTILSWFSDRQKDIATLTDAADFQKDVTDLVSAPADSPLAQAANDKLLAQFKPKTGANYEFLVTFLLEPTSGKVIAATDPTIEGKPWQDQDPFIHGQTGPYLEGPFFSDQFQAQAMMVAGPVRSADGQLLGVLVARLNLDRMSAVFLRRSSIHQTDDSYLVNATGLFVTPPRFTPDPQVLQQGVHSVAVEQCMAGNSGVVSATDYRNMPAIVVFRWLAERQMCLLEKQGLAEIFAPLATFEQALIAIAILVFLIAFVLAIGLSRTITRPVLALQTGSLRFGKGELNLRLAETSNDELGALAREFNAMADAISQNDEQLAQSASDYDILMNTMPDAIYFKDTESRFLRLNMAQAQNLGASDPEQALGKTDFDFQPKNIAESSYTEEQRLMQTGQPILNRLEFNPTPDGQDRWVSCTKGPIKDNDGHIIGLVGISRSVTDITVQKRIEAVLRQSEEHFRGLIEAAPGAILSIDATGKITLVNGRVESMFGYSRDELIGLPIETLLPDRFRVVHIDQRTEYFAEASGRAMGA